MAGPGSDQPAPAQLGPPKPHGALCGADRTEQGARLGSSDAAGAAVAVSLPLGFAESVFEQPLPMLMVSAPAVSFVSAERVLYLARQLRLPTERHCWQWPKCPWVRWPVFWFRAWTLPG